MTKKELKSLIPILERYGWILLVLAIVAGLVFETNWILPDHLNEKSTEQPNYSTQSTVNDYSMN